jgi:hypothetical protein
MELKFVKALSDDKYQITISTSAFSSADTSLMNYFGEPEVEMGGQVIEGVAQVDEFDLTGIVAGVATLSIKREGREEYDFSVAFDTDDVTTATALANAINNADPGVVATLPTSTPIFNVTSTFKGKGITYSGVDQIVIINQTANSANVLTVLDSNLSEVSSDLTGYYVEFDSATYGDDTQTVANSYIDTVTSRVQDSMEVLRENADTFTGESILTI